MRKIVILIVRNENSSFCFDIEFYEYIIIFTFLIVFMSRLIAPRNNFPPEVTWVNASKNQDNSYSSSGVLTYLMSHTRNLRPHVVTRGIDLPVNYIIA